MHVNKNSEREILILWLCAPSSLGEMGMKSFCIFLIVWKFVSMNNEGGCCAVRGFLEEEKWVFAFDLCEVGVRELLCAYVFLFFKINFNLYYAILIKKCYKYII